MISQDEDDDDNNKNEAIEIEGITKDESKQEEQDGDIPPSASGEISAKSTGSGSVESEPHRRRKSHLNTLYRHVKESKLFF